MKYACPECKAGLKFHTTFNKKIHITCDSCGIGDLLEHSRNRDEIYLEFLSRHDSGLISKKQISESVKMEGMIRDEEEINAMIKNHKPAEITKSILFSKLDYVSQFKVIKSPGAELGNPVNETGLDEPVIEHLRESGIDKLYKFQEEAIREIIYGKNIVIDAPTASGKTEAFLIPVIHKVKRSVTANEILAIFIYPTKSLSRDQLPKIQNIADTEGITVNVFDGDTSFAERQEILANPPNILVTNFDVIHYHLWHRTKLASLFSYVEMLVIDEVHVYTGIFGSNVHYILKRLQRLCRSSLQFIAASATLSDAKEFCEDLFGVPMDVICGSGRKGETDFAMLFPSLRTPRALMVDLTKRLTEKNHKTMIFSNSHLSSELLAMQARKQKINVKVHRAGLMTNYRKSVERQFKTGVLQAISCTPTLELGIDVGDVDGVISSTIPVNRLFQRIGRAARQGQRGFAFLALGNDPISQYYKNHPDDYFEDIEKSYIDPKNPFVEKLQVLAMACDKPISRHELKEHDSTIQEHLDEGSLVLQGNRLVPDFTKVTPMLEEYSIRGIGKSIDITLNGKKVGDRMLPIALEELHKDAIYFLAGTRYKVSEFDYPKCNHAKLQRIARDHPYYTKAMTEAWPIIKTVYERRKAFGVEIAFCKLLIEKKVHAYANIPMGHDVAQGQVIQLDVPLQYEFLTKGIVFCAPRPGAEMQKAADEEYTEASGYHAAEHIVIEGSNMITGGASQDLGGISMGTSGTIFIYDGAIGGSGASKALYDRFEKALERSMQIVSECPCQNKAGCPRCTFSYRCGNNNEFLHKSSAREVLTRINNGEETSITDVSESDKPLV